MPVYRGSISRVIPVALTDPETPGASGRGSAVPRETNPATSSTSAKRAVEYLRFLGFITASRERNKDHADVVGGQGLSYFYSLEGLLVKTQIGQGDGVPVANLYVVELRA